MERQSRKLSASRQFGEYLKLLRQSAGIASQREVAERLNDLGYKISQATIAQYETGRITDPDIEVLRGMLSVYNADDEFNRLLVKWARTKHASVEDPTEESTALWDLLETSASLRPQDIDRIIGSQTLQYQAKEKLIKLDTLDIYGVQRWLLKFPDLKYVLVIAPNFMDDTNPEVFATTVRCIRDLNAAFIFAGPKEMKEPGGRYMVLWHKLIGELGQNIINTHLGFVPLEEPDLRWIWNDHTVAVPTNFADAVGFRYTRKGGTPFIAIRMDDEELGKYVSTVMERAFELNPDLEKVIPAALVRMDEYKEAKNRAG